ncbi:hypothetical protein FNV43_RR21675 [Rhamnella rubrinervis]|uniref:Aminoacyl-tRNA synthetase class Ia domain-containing protein n=1 Tax=Rhamnella rubrinervis TaxID=2594499 RepID=A0A8K0GUE9_9ROSA|nr:hypothetical protein FNV43_RR21675 [Rhamnella rubrinervis]
MDDVCEGKDFSFSRHEERILDYWSDIKALDLARTMDNPEYVFYDGPPFATGLPHYGQILAGTIKDIVTRYQSMTDHHVTRRFGWDCHGLPVENEIDKKLGIKRRDDVLNLSIGKYNEECRSIVTRYVEEWEKVMPYSTGCKTPLSNFEGGQDYKVVNDPEIMVTFPIAGDPRNAALVAWTTTPWTLPSYLALCVNATFTYVKKVSGPSLVGLKYEQLFNYFSEFSDVAFRVVADNYVTGIVHCAPTFGEDDYYVCSENDIIRKGENLIVAVDDDGCFTERITDFSGCYVKHADKGIIESVRVLFAGIGLLGLGALCCLGYTYIDYLQSNRCLNTL